MALYPNLRHLRAMHSTARLGSVKQAAEVVHMSQPAVTQAIQNLERHFAVQLFERRTTGMYLTGDGEIVLARVERALRRLDAAFQRAAAAGRRNGVAEPAMIGRRATVSQLRAFVAVTRSGGFASAARELGCAQPTVHRSVREFERLAATPLFERVSQGVLANRLGRELATDANLALKEIELVGNDLEEHRGIVQGHLTIAALPLVRSYILPSALIAVSKRHPAASFSLIDGPYEQLLDQLRLGDVDLLLGALRDPQQVDDVEQETLFNDSVAVVARRGHPLAGVAAPSRDDLLRYPWVVPRIGTPTRSLFARLFDGDEPPAAKRMETSSLVTLRSLLMQSDRLAILSRRQIYYEEQAGMLTTLPVPIEGGARPIGVTTRRNWQPTRLHQDFLHAIRVACSRQAV